MIQLQQVILGESISTMINCRSTVPSLISSSKKRHNPASLTVDGFTEVLTFKPAFACYKGHSHGKKTRRYHDSS